MRARARPLDQRRQRAPASRRSCRAAPARRARGSVTALPMCASATSSVRLAGRKAAFSGSSVSGWPPASDRRGHGAARRRARSGRQQAQRGVEVLGRAALEAGAREALQAADRERGQHRRLRVARRRSASPSRRASATLRRLWRSCDSIRSKNWFMRAMQALVLEHQRVADHHARHAGVLLAELQQHARATLLRLHAAPSVSRSTIWLTSVKTLCSMNSIRPSNICALLAKWRYSAASRHLELGGQRRGGDALGAGLLEHASPASAGSARGARPASAACDARHRAPAGTLRLRGAVPRRRFCGVAAVSAGQVEDGRHQSARQLL